MKNRYYKILGLPDGAPLSDVRKQYRRLVMQYHPDKNKSANAEARFIEITEAYEIVIGKRPLPNNTLCYTAQKRTSRNKVNAAEELKKRQEEAKSRYQEQKLREFMENELYFRKLTKGFRWQVIKISAIVGLVLALAMSLDLLLPHHYDVDKVTAFHSNSAYGLGGRQVSLIQTEENGDFWLEHFNSSLYYGNHEIIIESSWLFHNPIRIQKQDKVRAFGFPINFNVFRMSPLLIPLLVLPLFTIYYKRRKIAFTVLYHFCYYGVNGIMLLLLLTNDRWAHILTLGFL